MTSEMYRQTRQNTKSDWAKENMYLDRIASLMDTNRSTLNSYAKIKLWEDGPNYQKVVKYVNNSQCRPNTELTVVNIHRVWLRNADDENLFHLPNRHFLWHGTKRANFPNILDTGFKQPENCGQMLGSGIYFADRITKSSNYSDDDVTFLLLCEVALGKVYSCKRSHNDWKRPPVGFDSVKANGVYVPDWTESGRYCGAQIPFGRTAKCTKYDSHAVNFNEFIVYDPSRIIIRFLVEVKIERVFPTVPLKLVTPGSVVPINKTKKKTTAGQITSKKTPIKATPSYSTAVNVGPSAQTTTRNNNLRSTATKPTTASSQTHNGYSGYSTYTSKITSVPAHRLQFTTTNLHSSYSTPTATKPTSTSQPAYNAYNGYSTYTSPSTSVSVHRTQQQKKGKCVIL